MSYHKLASCYQVTLLLHFFFDGIVTLTCNDKDQTDKWPLAITETLVCLIFTENLIHFSKAGVTIEQVKIVLV